MEVYEKYVGPAKSYLRYYDCFDLLLPTPDKGFRWGKLSEIENQKLSRAKIQFDVASDVSLLVSRVSENKLEPAITSFDLTETAMTDAFLEHVLFSWGNEYRYTKWMGSKCLRLKGKPFLFSECMAFSQGENLVRVFWLRFSVEGENFVVKGSFPSSETDIWRKYLVRYAFPVSISGISKRQNAKRNVELVFSQDQVSDQRMTLSKENFTFSNHNLISRPKFPLPDPVEIIQIWDPGVRDFLSIGSKDLLQTATS